MVGIVEVRMRAAAGIAAIGDGGSLGGVCCFLVDGLSTLLPERRIIMTRLLDKNYILKIS